MSWDDPNRYDDYIARALATPGGHLSIGRGGFALHFENARLSGYDDDVIKAVAVAAGLPVIDSRMRSVRTGREARGQRSDDRGECRAQPPALARAGIRAARRRRRRLPQGRR